MLLRPLVYAGKTRFKVIHNATNKKYHSGGDSIPRKPKICYTTDTMFGEQRTSIIGLGDQAIKEAGERIQSTVIHKEYDFPKMKIVINLAPSHIKKRGSHFDLAMAIGLLVQTSQITVKGIEGYGFITAL